MKYKKYMFIILFSGSCYAMESLDKDALLQSLGEQHQSLNQSLITQVAIISGVAVSEIFKNIDQCDSNCGLKYYIPLIPGALLFVHNLLKDYLPSRR